MKDKMQYLRLAATIIGCLFITTGYSNMNVDSNSDTASSVLNSSVIELSSPELNEIKFSEVFHVNQMGSSYVIEIPDDSKLVFDGGDDYFLHGKDLILIANQVIIRATTTIKNYSDTDLPDLIPGFPPAPPVAVGQIDCNKELEGCQGIGGAEGSRGAKGNDGTLKMTRVVFLVNDIQKEGNVTLTLDINGQKGGKGQQGGKGGQGAEGGRGKNETFPGCVGPGRGGQGGTGGPAGPGGQGGKGGRGGHVILSSFAEDLINKSESFFVVKVTEGKGGDPGDPGIKGDGGFGGSRGSAKCPGDKPGPAPDGDKGSSVPVREPFKSEDGKPGVIEKSKEI